MQLFYQADISPNSTELLFDRNESKHIAKVLRKKPGDTLYVTNGKGTLFTTELQQANPQKCIAKVIKKTEEESKNYRLHMAVSPTKMNDRFEWFLEKATEIGIDSITPIICEHSERKVIKLERYERIIQSAMKQSLRYSLPVLHPQISFSEFLNQPHSNTENYIAHCENTPKEVLKNSITPQKDYLICIGPEGDFSEKEIKLAALKGFTAVSLGNARLRTETAAIVACHTFALNNL
ncbi:16S rRNA (uracil1498-N3)-methyltransferase [Mesonia hippocampi]|uniref:Ribosomal RNA small subunit methyltransferase E n=1 Tax=Mesonia hippocampi TaxID=1628250 RepID=A0A840EZ24_9FLAO|nr:16S rRNA (uracil(1498)-N(3))-methyltransferase [Mesonia hippocampi]MBB4119274.1 16S rRNA (uracil1498-N3)-methyltransferase [Mesonia hippocampi]